jgi:hypothetical protein
MKPKVVTAVENPQDGLLDGWDLGAGRGKIPLNQLCNVMSPTAGSLWDGVSPLGVAEEAATVDAVASARQRAASENRAEPGLVLVVDDIWGEGLTAEQEAAALLKLKDRYTAAADAGTPVVFSKGTEIHAPHDRHLRPGDAQQLLRGLPYLVAKRPFPAARRDLRRDQFTGGLAPVWD